MNRDMWIAEAAFVNGYRNALGYEPKNLQAVLASVPAPEPVAELEVFTGHDRLTTLVKFTEGKHKLYAAPQPPAEPVSTPAAHMLISGALYDFMGWLTSRETRLVLSSADNAGPAAEAITEFAKMRGLQLSDAAVLSWQEAIAAAEKELK